MKNGQNEKEPILTLHNVVKRFGGVTAADQVSLELYGGEVFGLIGPNGSGKTTLINLITGIYSADEGDIMLGSKRVTRLSTHARSKLGIIRSFQHPRLLGRCDIETNILVGVDLAVRRRLPQAKAYQERMNLLLETAGLAGVNLKDSTERLSYGQQKMLEIVRAMLSYPQVLLLDEPAAGLNRAEMNYIRALISMATKEGIAVLLIEHAMDLVMEVCNRITVLNFGKQITTGLPSEVQENTAVIEAYLGGGGELAANQ